MTTKRFMSWKSRSCSHYVESAGEDDNEYLSAVSIKQFVRRQPSPKHEGDPPELSVWTAVAGDSVELQANAVQSSLFDDGVEKPARYLDDRHHEHSSQSSLSPGQSSLTRSPREITSAEKASLACESLAVESSRSSPSAFKRAESDGNKTHKRVRSTCSSARSIQPHVQEEDEESSSSKRRVPSALHENRRQLISTDRDSHNIRLSNTEVSLGCYEGWRPPGCTSATVDTEWESGTRLENEALPVEPFSNVLHRATLTASPNITKNKASHTATEATHLQTIEKLCLSTVNCENHKADQQSATQKQAQPLTASFLESLATVRCSSQGSFPAFSLKTPQIHEEVASTLTNDLYSVSYQHPPAQYFTPIQHSDSALATRPLQSRMLHQFLQPLTSDKSLPFLLPPPSPSGPGAAPSLNPSRTSPSSPRIIAGSLFCPSLPSCDTSVTRENPRTSDPTSPAQLNLPGSSPNSPLFKEPTCEISYCSPAVVTRSRQLSEPAHSVTHDHQGRSTSAKAPKSVASEEDFASVAPSSSSSGSSQELSPTEQCHAATEVPHIPYFPAQQGLQLVETTGAVKIELPERAQSSKSETSPHLHRNPYFDTKQGSLVNRETGFSTDEIETVGDSRSFHNVKGHAAPIEEETGFARGNSPWTDTSRLIKDECSSDGNLFFIKETGGLPVSARAPSSERNLALDAKKSHSPTYVPVSSRVEDEGLPPLLLGRNALPLPPEETKSHPYGYASTIDHPQQRIEQSVGLFLPEQRLQEFAARRREPTGVLPDPNKPQQTDSRSDCPQQLPPLATSPSASDELAQPARVPGSSMALLYPQQIQNPFQYACVGTVDTPAHLVTNTAVASTHSLSPQAQLPAAPQQLRLPYELDTKSLPIVGPPTLLGSYPFAFPNAFWGASRQIAEPAADHVGQQVYGYPNVLACPLLPSQHPPNLQESDAAAFAAFNCGIPLPPPWLSETPPENVPVVHAVITSADNVQRHAARPNPLSPRQVADVGSYVPRMVGVPSLFRGAGTDLSLEAHTQAGPAHDSLSFLPSAAGAGAATLTLPGSVEVYRKSGSAASRDAGDSGRCSLRLAKSSRKRRLLQNSAPPESASRDHKDFLLELLACSLEPVKGVHMDRLRKTWVASWLVGKRRVTRIFSFQKFGFFGAREQAIRQRREALLNPELESEEAQRVVTAAAAAAAAAVAPSVSAVCTATAGAGAADAAEQHQPTGDPDRRLVQKIADSLPFVVGVTYHGESFSWIANHRKPMGKIVARRRFSIAEYGFLEARRRAAVMMFHWHKQGRVVEPEDYDQGAAAIFNAQQSPQLPDTANSEGFVYWYPACTANEPLYLMTAFDEESCDEAMVLLASICGNPWKKVCKGQPQGGVEEVFLSGGETAATARFLSSFHSDGACTNWYLSNSQRRERNSNFWEGLKKGRHHLDAGGTCILSPRKRLKCSSVSRKNPHAKKYASSDVQEAQALRSLLTSPARGAQAALSRRQSQALCKNRSGSKQAEAEGDDSCWEGRTGSACRAVSSNTDSVQTVSYTRKDAPMLLRHRVLVSSRIRERPGDTRKKAVLLRNSVSAAHTSSMKENPVFCSSTYWTRRKQAEQRARKKDESDTEVQNFAEKENVSAGSESALYKADTQRQRTDAHEQPHSAQDVLRACFGSEPASAMYSAAASQEVEEAEALTCQLPSVEADETGHEAEEEEVGDGEEEEEVEEEDEEEEPTKATFHETGTVRTFAAGSDGSECRNRENRRPPTIPPVTSSQALSQGATREFSRLKIVRGGDACEEERRGENRLPTLHGGQERTFNSGASPFTQASHLLENASWFSDSCVQNVTLAQQQQEQFYQEDSRKDSIHPPILPATKCNLGAPPLYVLNSSSAQLSRAGKKTKPVVCAFKEKPTQLSSVHSENYQDCSPLLVPQTQLCANVSFECSDAAPLPCRMELVVQEHFSK